MTTNDVISQYESEISNLIKIQTDLINLDSQIPTVPTAIKNIGQFDFLTKTYGSND